MAKSGKPFDEDKFKSEILKRIDSLHIELEKIERETKQAKNTRQRPTHVNDTIVRNTARMRAIQLRMESLHKQLNKVWGDKRSTELTGPNGKDLFTSFGNAMKEAAQK